MENKAKEIMLKRFKFQRDFIENLKGCIKDSNIDPLDIKKIWHM